MPDTLTDDIYWAHQPKPLRAFRESMGPAERSALAEAFSRQGFIVDALIMGFGWDPVLVMNWRERNGIPYDLPYGHPLAGQFAFTWPNPLGLALYDPANPPRGAIVTSTNAADYPPIDPPASSLQPTSSIIIIAAWTGHLIGGKRQYFASPDRQLTDGQRIAGPEGPLVAVVNETPFGREQHWNPAV